MVLRAAKRQTAADSFGGVRGRNGPQSGIEGRLLKAPGGRSGSRRRAGIA